MNAELDGKIRRRINLKLSRKLSDREWRFLVKGHWITDIGGEGASTRIVEAASHICEVRDSQQADERLRQPRARFVTLARESRAGSALSERREAAVSILLAREAAMDPDVERFRARFLESGIIPGTALEQWIATRAQTDAGEVPHGDSLGPGDGLGAWRLPPAALRYGRPTGDGSTFEEELRPTSCRGALEHLALLSESLAERYCWPQWQAAVFVLTGSAPRVPSLTFRVDRKLPAAELEKGLWSDLSRLKVTTRIVLSIDPSVPPDDVARKYRVLRAAVHGRTADQDVRYRELSDKHLELAIFAAARPEHEPAADRRRAWDKQHPQWKYRAANIANFRRDYIMAQRRLLHPEYGGVL